MNDSVLQELYQVVLGRKSTPPGGLIHLLSL